MQGRRERGSVSWHRFRVETSIRVELGGRLKILAIRHALDPVQLPPSPSSFSFLLENPGNLEIRD